MKKSIVLIVILCFISSFAYGASATRKAFTQNFFVSHSANVSDNNGGTNGTAPTDETTNGAPISTGNTATTNASVLTDGGASFDTDGVVGAAAGTESDYVNIVSGTGVVAGIYKITARDGTTLTLATDPGDSAAGDIVYNVGGSWATIQYAADTCPTPGADGRNFRVNIKADSTYTLGATIDFDTNTPTQKRAIVFEGYTTTVGDIMDGSSYTLAEVDGNNTAVSCINLDKARYQFIGIEFHNSSSYIIDGNNALADEIKFIRCIMHSPTAANTAVIYAANGATYWLFAECLIYAPTGTGFCIIAQGGNTGWTLWRNYLQASNNASSYCARLTTDSVENFWGNIFDGNVGGSGVYGGFSAVVISHNIFYRCVTGILYRYTTFYAQRIFNNVFHSCTTGIDGTASTGSIEFYGYNAFYNCTNNYSADAATINDLENHQLLTGDPYIGVGTYDFDIDDVAGEGKLLQSNGWATFMYNATFTLNNTGQHIDIGATGYEGAGGGGGQNANGAVSMAF